MANMRSSLHSKVHDWMNKVGFRLNSTNTIEKSNVTVDHYFFKTFNFIEQHPADLVDEAEFVCFDKYGEKMKVRSLLDLQSAFYENLSELR